MEKRKFNKNEKLEKSKIEKSFDAKEMNEDELNSVSGGRYQQYSEEEEGYVDVPCPKCGRTEGFFATSGYSECKICGYSSENK